MDYFNLDEQKVFDKVIELYGQSFKLDSRNFDLAVDIAKTFYGIEPPRNEAALLAWERALKITPGDSEKQEIYLNFARIKVNMGLFNDAQFELNRVTNIKYQVSKERIIKILEQKMKN